MDTKVAKNDSAWATNALRAVVANVLLATPAEMSGDNNLRAAKLAESLGLHKQSERFKKLQDGEISTVFQAVRLDGEELACWEIYCPTHYVEGTEAFNKYSFDTIPVEVLEHWTNLKKKYPFDAFEIWTTERPLVRLPDPLLVGVYNGARYLLARWGEEAPDLLPFSEVLKRTLAMRCLGVEFASLPAGAVRGITNFLRQDVTAVVHRADDDIWSKGAFFYKTHCGQRLMSFFFQGRARSRYHGVCSVCGDTSTILST